ncbi:MAG: ABC transporter ATP-binding protein [Oscillospiraceae bacterium]
MKLEIKNIRKSFEGREVLHGVSFEVESGKATGFLGRNGAGKSTTFRCLMHVLRMDSGEFLLDGQQFDPSKHHIGYMPEERGMYAKIGVKDQLVYFSRLKGASPKEASDDADYWIEYFGLKDYSSKKLETLSKGNQQKIQIAQAFLHNPDIVILDEPFSGLDPINAQAFKDAIRDMVNKGKLVIFSSHQMAYVEEICDNVAIIDKGNMVISGNLEQIKEQEGRGRYYIECRPGTVESISASLKERGLEYTLSKENILLTKDDSSVLPGIIEEHFGEIMESGMYRPTLQDIFIEKVGEIDA